MATIDELAGRGGAIPQSSSIGQAQSVASAQYKVGDSLANDLAGIIKPTAQLAQKVNQLSVKAAQRVASDKKTELAMFMTEQDNLITEGTTSEELRDIQLRKQAFFVENTKSGFDNQDAQDTFDNMYVRDGGLAVAQSNAQLEVRALKQDAETNRTVSMDSLSAQLRTSMNVSPSQVEMTVDSITAGNYYSKEQGYMDVATSMNNALNERYKINKNLPIYNENGSINSEAQAAVFNQQYGGIATMDENGVITKVGDTTESALKSVIGNWNALKTSKASSNNEFIAELTALQRSVSGQIQNNGQDYVDSNSIQSQIDNANDSLLDISKKFDITPKRADPMIGRINELKNQKQVSMIIEGDLSKNSLDNVRTYLEDGKTIENFYDNDTGKYITYEIPKAKYQAIVNHMKEDMSNRLFSTEVTEDNYDSFVNQYRKLQQIEQLQTGQESAFTKKYTSVYDASSKPKIGGRQSLGQSLVFHRENQTNDAYKYDSVLIGRLEELMTKKVDGKPLTDVQIAKQSNSLVEVDKINKAGATSSNELDVAVREGLTAVSEGDGFFGRMFTFEADMAVGSIDAMKWYISSNRKFGSAKDTVKDLKYTDYGKLLTGTDQRLVVPIGVEESTFKNALHLVRENYNKERTADLQEDDVILTTTYDKKTNNFLTTMRNKNTDQLMGTLDVNSAEMLKASKFEEVDYGRNDNRRGSRR